MEANAWFSSIMLMCIGLFGGLILASELHRSRLAVVVGVLFSMPLLLRLFVLATLY
jgi:hypothetical protein